MGRRSAKNSPSSRSLLLSAVGILVAVPALSYSFYTVPVLQVSQSGVRELADAAVGLSAAVAANPYNTIAAQLDQKAATLNAREADLAKLQAQVGDKNAAGTLWGMASFAMSLVLLGLVAFNFYLDMRRRGNARDPLARRFLVDLRS